MIIGCQTFSNIWPRITGTTKKMRIKREYCKTFTEMIRFFLFSFLRWANMTIFFFSCRVNNCHQALPLVNQYFNIRNVSIKKKRGKYTLFFFFFLLSLFIYYCLMLTIIYNCPPSNVSPLGTYILIFSAFQNSLQIPFSGSPRTTLFQPMNYWSIVMCGLKQ